MFNLRNYDSEYQYGPILSVIVRGKKITLIPTPPSRHCTITLCPHTAIWLREPGVSAPFVTLIEIVCSRYILMHLYL